MAGFATDAGYESADTDEVREPAQPSDDSDSQEDSDVAEQQHQSARANSQTKADAAAAKLKATVRVLIHVFGWLFNDGCVRFCLCRSQPSSGPPQPRDVRIRGSRTQHCCIHFLCACSFVARLAAQ